MAPEPSPEERDSLERLVGSVVGEKYRIDRLIGRGGMGAVFQATNLGIGKRVALKFLNRDAAGDRDAAERFQREALAASVVESAHIVHIFDSGTSAEGLPFLVMELLAGEDLRTRLKREGRLAVPVAVEIAAQVLHALRRAHAAGLVHRDLKPDNVFLCERDDGGLLVKIVDFGISKLSRSSTLDTLTRRGTVLGTAFYMSPEQAQAFEDIDGRTDLFSVGAILFECLTGQPPHVAPTYEAVLIAICTKDAADVRSRAPDVPESLARVIRRALARERAERYGSAEELLAALAEALPNVVGPSSGASTNVSLPAPERPRLEVTSAASATALDPPQRGRGKPRTGTWVTAVVAAIAGFALTAFWMGQRATVHAADPPPVVAAPEPAALRVSASADVPAASPPAASTAAATTSTGSLAASSAAPTAARAAKPPGNRARARPAAGEPGVASGLELSTREP